MAIKFANFARSTLAVGIGTGDTSISLATGTGARFPTLSGGDYFYATLENAALSREIVKVTARATDTLTVVRAQDGTTAASWVVGDTLSLRLNAAAINDSIASVVHQSGAEVIINSVSGTDTITGTLSPTLTSYSNGQTFRFVAAGANTGAVTINLDGLGAKAVTKNGASALEAGDIAAGAAVQIMYDGTQFQLTSGAGGGGGASAGGVIYENKRVLTSSFTGGTSKSGHMVGPLTIATGQTLTVPTGEALMIFNPSTSGTGTTDVLTTGAQTFQGQKTFAAQAVFSSGLVSTSPTLDIGYDTGAGGTVTQATSRTTAVTINKPTGSITMFSAAGSTTWSGFLVSNSVVTANDTIVLSLRGGNTNFYTFQVGAVTSGQFQINFVANATATDAPVINFAVIKGATS